MSFSSYKFDVPSHSKSIIKVIGVGGGGSNAVNHMFNQGIKDVEFVVCNTDEQALKSSSVPNKLQIGTTLTEGLGAGANPERGKQAALESKEEIRELLGAHTKMVFITAGMGGGTGTGAAPVIAKVAKEMDILTVGIVTAPFAFEGRKKRTAADNGIKELSENCDTVLVILNDKLREMFGNLPIRAAFAKADNVLTTAAKSIAEIITVTSEVNVDFEDVKTVMKDSGAAVMGSAITEGENRALRAAEESLSSPLLNNTDIHGAQKILLSIMSGDQAELEMDELTEITDYIQEKAGDDSEVIFGHGIDSTLGTSIRVTVIATGFAREIESLPAPKKSIEAGPIGATAPQAVTEEVIEPVAPVISTTYSVTPPASATQLVANEPVRKPAPVTENNNRIVFDLDSETGMVSPSYEEEVVVTPEPIQERDPQQNRMDERRERLRRLSADTYSDASIKEKLEVPAYLRRNVQLENVVPSAEQKISRFNLNDDNELLGDNRFLHDNVD
ncbi:cell division protein FtsZ [Rufibacter latericius]|uniref:Cell division protein FtsZ n=1 Tax=Rufibacter latericius TaxID=2487040 RepID=A0A3M9MWX0_9BACT|nr:cell division protein FtsZ [Rufibacter latericius]RNI29268.1 cell division protein FtsZ [Rufibacter latericius]